MLPRTLLLALAVCAALLAATTPAPAQTFTWNNTGSDWATASNWTPAGPPVGNGTVALFNVTGTYGTAAINQPTWGADPAFYASLSLNPTAQFTGWNFASTGTLTQFGFRSTGPVTHTISGPSLQDLVAGNGVLMQIDHGSTVAFTGTATANTRTFGISLMGSTLRLDNSTTNNANRIAFFNLTEANAGVISNGGTLDFVGHADGSTETLELYKIRPGYSRVNIAHQSTTAPTVLTATTFERPLASTINFTATGGTLGAAGNNPRIILSNQAAGFMGAWATVNGSELAFYDTTNGVRAAVNADFAQVYTTTIGANLTEGQFGALNQDAGTANINWTGAAGAGNGANLRILPGANGQSLSFALDPGNHVDLRGIVLAGPRNYTINANAGAGIAGAGDHRTFGVLDENATLTLNVPIRATTFIGIVKSGDGILDLAADMTGPGAIAESGSPTTPMYLNAGVLRVNVGPNGSLSKTSGQRVSFRGGILEIAGGTDGLGTDADFTRILGTGAGHVNWSDSAGRGGGGFSAFGSDASVNIGGSSTPDTLLWHIPNNASFLSDGAALLFGSRTSNARLRWFNPINLDNGTPGSYMLREIQVRRGAGTLNDYTLMTGAIGGSSTTDLLKSGAGVLELGGLNTFGGNTLIHGGTLVVGDSASLGTALSRTGNVVVGRSAVLAGLGDVMPEVDHFVTVNPGGAIRGGSPVTSSLSQHTGTLNVFSDLTIHSTATDRGTIQFEFHRTGNNAGTASKFVLAAPFHLNLNPGSGNQFALELVDLGVTSPPQAGETYTVTLATLGLTEHIRLNGVNLPDGVIAQSNYVLQSSSYEFDPNYSLAVVSDATNRHLQLTFSLAPIPEPAPVLAVAVLALAFVGRAGRRLVATPLPG
jgi:autotransporter-associated beta strand protein